MSCIVENLLYLGDCDHANDHSLIKRHNIKYIVNATKDVPDYFSYLPYMQYLSVPIEDLVEDTPSLYFDKVNRFIDRAKTNSCAVLIHCKAGVSRSATLAIAYIMKSCDMTAIQACLFVQRQRSCVAPNPGFMKQLVEYEKRLQAEKQHSQSAKRQQN